MTGATDETGTQPKPERRRLPSSPCVGVCAVNEATEWCVGCGRTGDDVANWSDLDDQAKRDIWRQLPGRLATMGVGTFRLAPEPEEVADFVVRSLREKAGCWAVGSASTALAFEPMGDLAILEDADHVAAWDSAGNGIRLRKHDRVRGFGLALESGQARMQAVALVLPRGRARLKQADGADAVRHDCDAIRPEDQSGILTELAIEGGAVQAMLRTPGEGAGIDASGPGGAGLRPVHDQAVIDRACQRGATIIVETAMGRVESRRYRPFEPATTDAIAIPEAFAACAVFWADDANWLAEAFDLL